MEELLDLRAAIEERRYEDAIFIVDELTAMARKDTYQKIGSFIRILLIHLIKSHAETRMARSWNHSIRFALEEIAETNQREYARGVYMDKNALRESIEKRFLLALDKASEEAFGGAYTAKQLARMIDAEAIKAEALNYILNGMPESEE